MTICIYTGRPGSGKSLHAARLIINALKNDKRPVLTNFEVKHDENWRGRATCVENRVLTADYLVCFARDTWRVHEFKEDGILLVIDEAQLLFNSRNWQDSNRMEFLQFMSQHRKYGYQIVLIAQSDIMIDKQFRTLIEYETIHRKVSNYGAFGGFIKFLAMREVFVTSTYYYEQKNHRVDSTWYFYSKKAASIYDSYKSFDMANDLPLEHESYEKPNFILPKQKRDSGAPVGAPLPDMMV